MSNRGKKGHNRVGGIDAEHLMSFVQRVEKLEEEKAAMVADIRDVFSEAKGNGFDVKALRQVIKDRRIDAQEREEAEAILDTYRRAAGLIPELDEMLS